MVSTGYWWIFGWYSKWL